MYVEKALLSILLVLVHMHSVYMHHYTEKLQFDPL